MAPGPAVRVLRAASSAAAAAAAAASSSVTARRRGGGTGVGRLVAACRAALFGRGLLRGRLGAAGFLGGRLRRAGLRLGDRLLRPFRSAGQRAGGGRRRRGPVAPAGLAGGADGAALVGHPLPPTPDSSRAAGSRGTPRTSAPCCTWARSRRCRAGPTMSTARPYMRRRCRSGDISPPMVRIARPASAANPGGGSGMTGLPRRRATCESSMTPSPATLNVPGRSATTASVNTASASSRMRELQPRVETERGRQQRVREVVAQRRLDVGVQHLGETQRRDDDVGAAAGEPAHVALDLDGVLGKPGAHPTLGRRGLGEQRRIAGRGAVDGRGGPEHQLGDVARSAGRRRAAASCR